jgi:N-methylhydantoinase B/oxoprolinase/acetone carboxylase alpha subunit
MEDLVTVIFPDDCFLNPRRPAPISLRHLTMGRVAEVVKGTLAPIFSETMPATHNGSLNCYSLLGYGREDEDDWLCFEVMAAGSGGRARGDGLDAFSWNTRLKNAPIEFMETVYPVRVEEYALRAESAGAGLHRGGYGLIRAIRTLRNCRLFFLDERHKTQPWGLYGGRAAAANDAYVERANGEIIQLPAKFDALKLAPGDMFVVRTGGGGGWGDPFLRDPEKVARDVVNNLLTPEEARDWYGVVVTENHIDGSATEVLRSGHEPSSDWIDRGVAVDAPVPGEFRTLATPPRPWLAVPHVLETAFAD